MAFEAALKEKQKGEKKEKKGKKDKKKKKKDKKSEGVGTKRTRDEADEERGDWLSGMLGAGGETGDERKERKRREREEREREEEEAKQARLRERMINPEVLGMEDTGMYREEEKKIKRSLSGLALARQMAQERREGSASLLEGESAVGEWKKPSTPARKEKRGEEVEVREVSEREAFLEGVREEGERASKSRAVGAALRARLKGDRKAYEEELERLKGGERVVVVEERNVRGEAVRAPRAAEGSVKALAGEERGLLRRQDSMRELEEVLLAGEEYGEEDEKVMRFGTGDAEKGDRKKKKREELRERRDGQQLRAAVKGEERLRKCWYCSANVDREMVISVGNHSYLCLVSITPCVCFCSHPSFAASGQGPASAAVPDRAHSAREQHGGGRTGVGEGSGCLEGLSHFHAPSLSQCDEQTGL